MIWAFISGVVFGAVGLVLFAIVIVGDEDGEN